MSRFNEEALIIAAILEDGVEMERLLREMSAVQRNAVLSAVRRIQTEIYRLRRQERTEKAVAFVRGDYAK